MESNLPIRVYVVDWTRIPALFRREIARACVVLGAGRVSVGSVQVDLVEWAGTSAEFRKVIKKNCWRTLTEARSMAAWLVHEIGNATIKELVRRLIRDLATMRSAANHFEKRRKTEQRLAETIESLKRELQLATLQACHCFFSCFFFPKKIKRVGPAFPESRPVSLNCLESPLYVYYHRVLFSSGDEYDSPLPPIPKSQAFIYAEELYRLVFCMVTLTFGLLLPAASTDLAVITLLP